VWKILTYYGIADRFINIFKTLHDNSWTQLMCQDCKWVNRVFWDCLKGSTRLHLFTIPLHYSHRLRHAKNYEQVGIRHRMAEAEPLNGFGLRWWHSDSGGGRERMSRDDYQARETKCTSWTEYKPGKNKGRRNHPALITTPIAVAQGIIEYVERFTYLGSVISSDGDVEADINTQLAKAAAVFRRLDNVWQSSTLSLKIKLDLFTSLIVSTAIYTSETWKSTAKICQQLDVFYQRNLRKILGITWKDHVTNMEVLSRTGQRRLHGHCSRETTSDGRPYHQDATGRPANHAMSWTLRGSGRRRGRPTKTWRSTFKEDLVDRGVDWNSVRAVAINRSRRRTLAAHCPVKDRRI